MDNPNVGVYPVSPMPQWPLRNHVLRLVFKAVWQSFNLFQVLAYRAPAAKWIIVQVRPITHANPDIQASQSTTR